MERRGFLRGLVALPLTGGSVSLVGRPTSVAVPATDALHERYVAWLAYEYRAAVREHDYRRSLAFALEHSWSNAQGGPSPWEYAEECRNRGGDYMLWFPEVPDIESAAAATEPSSRATIVLSAVVCSLTGNIRS